MSLALLSGSKAGVLPVKVRVAKMYTVNPDDARFPDLCFRSRCWMMLGTSH